VKLILPIEVADEIQPHLPNNTTFVRADVDGNIDGDATDAEVYFSWLYYIKPTTLQKVLESAPKLRWHQATNAGVNNILTRATAASNTNTFANELFKIDLK
jgi:phosphoglycerate dehydrogenase-like enzyme